VHLRLQVLKRGRRVRFGDLGRTTPIELHLGRTRGGPLDRYYIAAFLDRHRADIRGHVLEVADPGYVERYGRGVTRVDVLDIDPANERATIVADVTDLAGVHDDTFDCIVFTQVLQLVYDAPAAMRSLARVLAPGGVLLATLPGITRSAPGKWDYWRFTAASARRLAEDAFGTGTIEVETHGNVLVAAGFLYGLGQDDFDQVTLDVDDPAFEVTVAVRAVKLRG
jgi:SAM-dependent methyltransferase